MGTKTRPPAPDDETPVHADADLLDDVEAALATRYAKDLADGEQIVVDARTGPRAAWIGAAIDEGAKVHELELFLRDVPGDGLDGALGVLVDYLQGVLDELFAAERHASLPLDWEGRPYDGKVVYARGEKRDYEAEDAAAALLDEPPAPRVAARRRL